MARAKKPVKTFHPLQMARSLEEQNEKIGLLIQTVHAILSAYPDLPEADVLRDAADQARAAIWPDEDVLDAVADEATVISDALEKLGDER